MAIYERNLTKLKWKKKVLTVRKTILVYIGLITVSPYNNFVYSDARYPVIPITLYNSTNTY